MSRRALGIAATALAALAAASIQQVAWGSQQAANAPGTAGQVAQLVAAAPSINDLPSNVTPSVAEAINDTAFLRNPSLKACFQTSATVTRLPACVYGDPHGRKTMVLWGDSHAFMWFPAVEAIAKKDHLRLVALFKYGCPVADIPVWNVVTNAPYPSCATFRTNVIARINRLDPSLVIMSEDFATEGSARQSISTAAWTSALEVTFTSLRTKIHKVLIGNTIELGPYAFPSACLAANPTDIQKCSVSEADATLSAERASEQTAATTERVGYVDPIPWTCSAVCTDVIGNMIVYYSAGHVSATYSSYLSGVLATALNPVM